MVDILVLSDGNHRKGLTGRCVEFLTMNAGEDEHSYARNSILQQKVMMKVKPLLLEAVQDMLKAIGFSPACFNVADLGSSTGPNAVSLIHTIITAVDKNYKQQEDDTRLEFDFSLNDLPQNDFNTMFNMVLSATKKLGCSFFLSGVPGSFYSRLFPSRRLHFVHSSYSLHFLSKVPEGLDENKGNIYIGNFSPISIYNAYGKQFERDFTEFLRLRSSEMVQGGCMFLTLIGRSVPDPSAIDCCHFWVLLNRALLHLVGEGMVKNSDLDSFNLPFYNPCEEEVKEIIGNEGSFSLTRLETSEFLLYGKNVNGGMGHDNPGVFEANTIRAVVEPMVAAHFGQHIIEPLFQIYAKEREDHVCSLQTKTTIDLVISLRKT